MNETFSLSLGRSPGLDSRISLTPVGGTVIIVDNDGQKQLSFFIARTLTVIFVHITISQICLVLLVLVS